ncbi:hypothetical protein SOVF_037830, partial [Spinacia oleracea]|jgi:hypothetical protein
MDEA